MRCRLPNARLLRPDVFSILLPHPIMEYHFCNGAVHGEGSIRTMLLVLYEISETRGEETAGGDVMTGLGPL
jgi:hypothetical protein